MIKVSGCIFGACASALIAANAFGQDCKAVLQFKAFDVYDSTSISKFQEATIEDMCKEEWRSVDEYNNKARSLGSGGQYGAISGFLNLDAKDVSSSLHSIYMHLCKSKSKNLETYLFSTSHSQVAKHAVEAWQDCINKTTLSGLWSTIEAGDDNKSFAILVRFRPLTTDSKLTLKDYSKKGISCKLGDEDVADLTPANKGYGNDFTIQCERTDATPQTLKVWINTNVNGATIGTFDLPSTYYFRMTNELRALEQRTIDLERSLEELSRRKVSVGPGVSSKVFGTGGVNESAGLPSGELFWTGLQDTLVNHTCGQGSVLAGMNFVMRAGEKGSNVRGPLRVEYICKNISGPDRIP